MSGSDSIKGIKRPGVLNKEQMKKLISQNSISNWSSKDEEIDKSSLDLHLGERYWSLPGGFKCRKDKTIRTLIQSAKRSISNIKASTIPNEGLILQIAHTYLFEIQEEVLLDENFYGLGSGKSSVGRIDVLTRLMADHEEKYDHVHPGEKNLYLEITPLSFPIRLFQGDSVYQLRIMKGKPNQLQIPDELVGLYSVFMKGPSGKRHISGDDQNCLRLSLKPTSVEGLSDSILAFKAKKQENIEPLELRAKPKTYPPDPYWECITAKNKEVIRLGQNLYALKVKCGEFYILKSRERFTLPNNIAVYGIAMTEEVGELRIHHAGFVHPGFGSNRKDHRGTPLIFEVRGHDMDMYLVDGDLMAKLQYFPMSEPSTDDSDYYEEQELKLSKIFGDFRCP